MTEDQWLSSQDPRKMLVFLRQRGEVSNRKLQLLAAACCRMLWSHLNTASRRAVETAELLPDEGVSDDVLVNVVRAANEASGNICDEMAYRAASNDGWYAAAIAGCGPEAARQPQVVRDIFGNPFHPVDLDPLVLKYKDGLVVRLAQDAYDNRRLPEGHVDPARIAAVADALEQAGCDNHEILSHLRQQESHYRGCWCIDLLLGKS
jgi:hypothetical protein